jgi:P4 family phage/plasmid primase-like protien
MTQNPLLAAALAYARRGWRVHPLKPKDKTPISKNGCKDATLDEQQIKKWWSTFPNANIGLATGQDFFVIDIDPDGLAWAEANDLPQTHESVTGRLGKHLLYKMPDKMISNSASQIARGVDVRGVGGYIVAPPSVTVICTECNQTTDKHKKTCSKPGTTRPGNYQWVDCEEDVPQGPTAEAPPWIVDACIKLSRPSGPASRFTLPDRIMHPHQHETLFKYACSIRASTMKTEDEIYEQVWEAAQTCEEIPTERAVRQIVRSAAKYPAGLSAEFAEKAINAFNRSLPDPPAAPAPDAYDDEPPPEDDGTATNRLSPNDIAEKILAAHKIINVDTYLYEYSTNCWNLISPSRLQSVAMRFDSMKWTTQKRRSEIASYISAKTHRQRQTWRQIAPYEVPVDNGVVDIRSMSIRPHRSDDFLQACSPVPFHADALSSELFRCLETYFGKDVDKDLKISALQEFFGYCLMPHARYKKALLCVGESDCGKSMIPLIIRMLVGGANTCSVSVEDMDDPRRRAPLLGKLVNLLTELTSGAMIADGGFKTLVSTEEPILFDPKNLTPVMDVPICKHVITTNTLPGINDRSRGTYNRLLMIRFNHVIPKNEQDTTLKEKLERELPGILLWALEGAQRLYHSGGVFSAAGDEEVLKYRAEQDPLTGFIADECEVSDEGEESEVLKCFLPDLRERYSRWTGKQSDPRRFAELLRGHGFEVSANPQWIGTQKKRVVYGLTLRSISG